MLIWLARAISIPHHGCLTVVMALGLLAIMVAWSQRVYGLVMLLSLPGYVLMSLTYTISAFQPPIETRRPSGWKDIALLLAGTLSGILYLICGLLGVIAAIVRALYS